MDTIQDALIRIGLNELYRIVMKVIVSPGLSQPHAGYGPRADLWHHSLATGIAAEQIAAKTGPNGDLAFTAGLLHDLGKIAIPDALFKIVIRESVEERPEVVAFIYAQDCTPCMKQQGPFDHDPYLRTVEEIEEQTGLRLFTSLRAAQRDALRVALAPPRRSTPFRSCRQVWRRDQSPPTPSAARFPVEWERSRLGRASDSSL